MRGFVSFLVSAKTSCCWAFAVSVWAYPSLCDTFLHGVWSYLRMLVQASAPPLSALSSAFSWLLLPPSIKAWAVHAS